MAVPKVSVLSFGAVETGGETTGERVKQLRDSSMRFRSERLSEASVALKSIREKGGHPVPLSDKLGGQGRHR